MEKENSVEENEVFEESSAIRRFFEEITLLTRFTGRFFSQLVQPPYELNELLKQCYLLGYKSLPLVGITAFIMGLVLTLQSQPTLAQFGAESWLPAMVSISIVREIAPVITAVICAGKTGSGIGAELSSMKVTEQIDAMEASGINPFNYVVVTRIVATTLMIPLLVIFSDAIGFIGSYVGVNIKSEVSMRLFFGQVFASLHFIDIIPAFCKSIFFGLAIGLISCFKGYTSNEGTAGVGKAANSAVVEASLAIFIIDMIAVQVTSFFM